MIDAGYDARLSQGFGDDEFGRSGPRHQAPIAAIGLPAQQRDTILPSLDDTGAVAMSPAIAARLDLAALHTLAAQIGAAQIGAAQIGAGQFPGMQASLDPGGSEQSMTIARQVADMAQGLAALADRLVGQGVGIPAETTGVAEGDCAAFLESQFRIRRLRARHLPALSLGEPAWDILLDLAVAQYWRRETSVTSLCIAADVPSTTALRWINSMTREGLIVRRPCQRDGRRSFLAIAPDTYQAMLAMAADSLRTEQRVRVRYQRAA